MKRIKAIVLFLQILYKLSKKTLFLCIGRTVLNAVQPMVAVMLSGRLINQLAVRESFNVILITIIALVLSSYAVCLLSSYSNCKLQVYMGVLKDEFSLSVGEKLMNMSYEHLEDPYLMDLKHQSFVPILEYGTFEYILEEFLPIWVGSIITVVSTIVLIGNKHTILLIPIAFTTVVNFLLAVHKGIRFKKVMLEVGPVERKIQYFAELANDFMVGKDIRLFQFDKVIMKKIKALNSEEIEHFSNLFYKAAFVDFWETMFAQIQMFSIYTLVAVKYVMNQIVIGEFFQVTGLFINFGNAVYQFSNSVINLRVRGAFLEKYMEFAEIPSEQNEDERCESKAASVSIKNLSFAYQNGNREILKKINLNIESGKTVAIVGKNGCGKTTLIKLISGLLKPTTGTVSLNEQELKLDARKYVSSIYQNYKLFPMTIVENVCTSYRTGKDVNQILERLDFVDIMKEKGIGLDTYLYKTFDREGVEFSQGQSQSLALARAIYKDTGILIMDEPTASLDAKAEQRIFSKMKEIAKGKTAVFVSHRLSACLFCDEIIVLANGIIAEQGTHQELMQIENGIYKELFMAQAKFYNCK